MLSRLRHTVALVLALAAAAGLAAAEPAITDFAFIQFSDIHVSPVLSGSDLQADVRGQGTIDWMCGRAKDSQAINCLGLTTPPPAFALATGDLTEFGVMGNTWAAFEHAVEDLPCPLYVIPGNHDNTWVAMYPQMRARYGGENYAFDYGGCRFICLSSASPQEPVPSLDGKTRAWLVDHLSQTPPTMPIFIALHHPLDSGEFAQPAEFDTFVDLLRGHNVALILYGHGHNAVHKLFAGMDGVMGGSTFGKRSGYALIDIRDRRLRAAYIFDPQASAKPAKGGRPDDVALLDKPLATTAPERLCAILEPQTGASVAGPALPVHLRWSPTVSAGRVEVRIDGQPVTPQPAATTAQRPSRFDLPLQELTPGAHLLTVEATEGSQIDLRTRIFYVERPGVDVLWRQAFPAAFKAAPVLAGKLVILAGNDGVITAVDAVSGAERWRYRVGAEILGAPAFSDNTLVVGAGNGKIYGLSAAGKQRWVHEVGAPVYGSVLIDHGVAYVGDNGGQLHAMTVSDGQPRWSFARADFSIESQPAVWNDLVVFGAWDGNLYAVGVADGRLRWKTPGPKASEGKAARYYAPADCGPIVVHNQLWVCDRGYDLGRYGADGAMQSRQSPKIAGIAAAHDGHTFFARATDDRVLRYDPAGEVRWEQSLPAGRFPIPPTEHAGKLYVCSNTGLLSMLDADTGKPLASYQVTPGFYVMAPVAVAAGDSAVDGAAASNPICYVAGMDGTVAAIRFH